MVFYFACIFACDLFSFALLVVSLVFQHYFTYPPFSLPPLHFLSCRFLFRGSKYQSYLIKLQEIPAEYLQFHPLYIFIDHLRLFKTIVILMLI